MRRYRRAPTLKTRAGSDEWYDDTRDEGPKTIDVYEADTHWEPTGILDPDGQPMQAYVGPDPIGFVWFEDE